MISALSSAAAATAQSPINVGRLTRSVDTASRLRATVIARAREVEEIGQTVSRNKEWARGARKRRDSLEESKRLHDVFTPYLRYFWFFAQVMADEPNGNHCRPPEHRVPSVHGMVLRGGI